VEYSINLRKDKCLFCAVTQLCYSTTLGALFFTMKNTKKDLITATRAMRDSAFPQHSLREIALCPRSKLAQSSPSA
jgi:hypothetical protein